jgi:hypothetical protein
MTYRDDNHILFHLAVDALETVTRLRKLANKDPSDKVAQARYLLANIRFNRAVKNYDNTAISYLAPRA